MQTQYRIVTDSCANLTDQLISELNLTVMPMVFVIDGKEYQSYAKDKPTEIQKYYDMMREKTKITTSCISSSVCVETFEPILQQGLDLLYLGFSSGLSATYSVAEGVLDELKTKYPERKIISIDTLGASMGQGLLVYHACRRQAEGASIDEVAQWMQENKFRLTHMFTVDSLSYLYRGGRLKKSSYIIASTLNIKPVLHVDDNGKLVSIGKTMGRRSSLIALVNRMEELAINPEEQIVFIGHGDCIKDAEFVAAEIRKRMNVKDIVFNYIDLVIGAHSGPGTVALFFLGEKR